MLFQKLVGNIYSVVVEIILWILPVVGAIAGFVAIEQNVLWILLGLIAGLILDVILFGPIIILFNIRSSLKNIENK